MQSIDKDENGKISFKEYMQWVLGDNWWVDGRVNSDGAMVQSGVSDANVMFQGKLWRLQKDDSKRKTKVVATLGNFHFKFTRTRLRSGIRPCILDRGDAPKDDQCWG